MADTLTPAQEMAVTHPGGPILVSAAAGSGKTKVLVERLIRQIMRTDVECNIDDFLIITFTKKAAAELRARIAKELAARLAIQPNNVHLQKQQNRIYLTKISTIHAFCGDLIREFAYELDVPSDFRMIEESESSVLQAQIVEELLDEKYEVIDSDSDFQLLVDGIGAGRDDRTVQKLILDVFRTAQCRIYPARWFQSCRDQLALSEKTGAEQTIWGQYLIRSFRTALEREAAQLRGGIELIDANPAVEKYRDNFNEQLELVSRLCRHETWDELYEAAVEGFSPKRLATIKNCEDPELQDRLKLLRKDVTKTVTDWLTEFYADSARVLADLEQCAGTLRALFTLTQEFEQRYSREKLRMHALDFNDLEHLAIRLLLEEDGETPTPAARVISNRFREILVDEYQDTNDVQDCLFRAISKQGKNRFMVGDVKQSIYRFRLADPTIFLDKYNRYPDAASVNPDERQKILLSHNFRSAPAILSAVNAVFERCMSEETGGLDYGPAEALRAGLAEQDDPDPSVELHCISTKQDEEDADTPEKHRVEAEYVAERIRLLLQQGRAVRHKDGRGAVLPGDIAILLRSPKNTASYYVNALARHGISAISDTGESILDSAEVESLICLLKVLDNAHRDVPLAGALLSPILGVSGSELSRAKNKSDDQGLYDAICAVEDPSDALRTALSLLQELREAARSLPLHRLLEEIDRKTSLEAVYGAMPGGKKRRMNLRQFRDLAAQYAEGGKRSLHQFLQYVEQLREQGGISAISAGGDAVKIMSIHKSKGLEFPVVVLSDLSKGLNKEDLSAMVCFHSTLGAGSKVYDPKTNFRYSTIARSAITRQTQIDNLSEEMRILYVAMTRAQDMLIMTYCSNALETRIRTYAQRLTAKNSRTLAGRAKCLGDWILQTAMLRTEAGALFEIGGKPEDTSVSDRPWIIRYTKAVSDPEAERAVETAPAQEMLPDPQQIAKSLHFVYPWQSSAEIPSKVTATQLKGRELDEEAADGRPERHHSMRLRKPLLIHGDRPLTSAQAGTAMHQAMQFLDFNRTESLEQIRDQLARMEAEFFLTPQQVRAVDPAKLFRVFEGELGAMIRSADRVVREFKFSLLTDAAFYNKEAAGEKMMLQGVTDCCLIWKGKITVVDFKTDAVRAGEEQEAAEKYRPQLETYSLALSRIFGLPVREKLLYFFRTDAIVRL